MKNDDLKSNMLKLKKKGAPAQSAQLTSYTKSYFCRLFIHSLSKNPAPKSKQIKSDSQGVPQPLPKLEVNNTQPPFCNIEKKYNPLPQW